MERRKSPEEKIQAEFEKRARKLGETCVKWYNLTGELPNINSHYKIEADNSEALWYLVIDQPRLGEAEVVIK